jgi:hypothetical protein
MFKIGRPRKKWFELDWLEFERSNSIDAMKELLIYIEKSWLASREKLSNDIKKFEESFCEDDQIPKHPFEFEERLIDEIKDRAYFAIFLSSYGIFEGSLNRICKLIENDSQSEKKMKNLNSNKYLKRITNYLKEVYNVDVDVKKIQPHWSKLSNYSKLRNIMIH